MFRVTTSGLIRLCRQSSVRPALRPAWRCCSNKPSTAPSTPAVTSNTVSGITKHKKQDDERTHSDRSEKDSYEKRKADDPREEAVERGIIRQEHRFTDIPEELRNKKSFHNAIGLFLQNNNQRRGQVEFIYAALRHLKKFGVHKDLETYKALLNIFPKGKMVPQNSFQRMFKHYPMHQDCCIKLLDEMEWHDCYPDKEISDLVCNIFGEWTLAAKKMKRQMYWKTKLKHINPYLDRRDVEFKQLEPPALAKIAMQMICRDPGTVIYEWLTDELEERRDKTWIVCGHSPMQQRLIEKHAVDKPIYVNGPFTVYVMEKVVSYLTLTADANPNKNYDLFRDNRPETAEEWRNWKTRWNSPISDRRRELLAEPTMHEQPDGTILACAATGTSSKESAAAWIDFLQRLNPRLAEISVVIRVRHPTSVDVVSVDDQYNEHDASAEAKSAS